MQLAQAFNDELQTGNYGDITVGRFNQIFSSHNLRLSNFFKGDYSGYEDGLESGNKGNAFESYFVKNYHEKFEDDIKKIFPYKTFISISHHEVEIEEEALRAAVHLSCRYINDRFLPDKAIDVLDESCSKVKLRGFKVPENIAKLEILYKDLGAEKENCIKTGNINPHGQCDMQQVKCLSSTGMGSNP